MDGRVELLVRPARPGRFTVSVRVPGWCDDAALTVAGEPLDVSSAPDKGYARVEREWRDGDRVELVLAMPVRRCYAHPAVTANAGRVAGPCVARWSTASKTPTTMVASRRWRSRRTSDFDAVGVDGLPEVTAVRGRGSQLSEQGWENVRDACATEAHDVAVTAVPYFAWDNRAPGAMQVWLRER